MAAIFCQESVVRGHHVYKSVWTPFVGKIFDTKREAGNVIAVLLVTYLESSMVFSAASGEDLM